MAGPDGISHDVGDCLGILPVIQKVGGDPRWPCDRQPIDHGPLILASRSLVESDARLARLPPPREREVVPVCGQVAETVQRRGRTMRYDPLFRRPLPGRNLRRQVKPGRPKAEIAGRGRPRQPIHTVSYPVEHARRGHPLQGCGRDASSLSLASSHQAPLIFGDRRKAAERRVMDHHYCVIAHLWFILQFQMARYPASAWVPRTARSARRSASWVPGSAV
jgi:hypothetical protein